MLFLNFVWLLVLIGPIAAVVYLLVRASAGEYRAGTTEGKIGAAVLIVLLILVAGYAAIELRQRQLDRAADRPMLHAIPHDDHGPPSDRADGR